MEERSHNGLFASYVAALTPETPAVLPSGMYDAAEQLWRDDGSAIACDPGCIQECVDSNFPTIYCFQICC